MLLQKKTFDWNDRQSTISWIFLEIMLGLTQPHRTGLWGENCPYL